MSDYTDEFLGILARTFEIEGGIADIKEDRGGFTNLGITIPFLQEYYNRTQPGRVATQSDIANLTKPTAADAYWVNIWIGMNMPNFPVWAREALFNSACGSLYLFGRMVRALQAYVGTIVDGQWGPMSMKAAEALNPQPPRRGSNDMINVLCQQYELIVNNDSSQHIFALGWYNRAFKLFDFGYGDGR